MKTGDKAKKFSPALFGLAILLFFLPFVIVSCQGEKIASFSGIELVTGSTVEELEMFEEEGEARKVDPETLAIVAFICAFVGLGFSFLKSRKSCIAPALMGLAGFIFLLLLKAKVDRDILAEAEGVLEVQYGAGFWLTCLVFLSAAGLNGFLFLRKKAGGPPLAKVALVEPKRPEEPVPRPEPEVEPVATEEEEAVTEEKGVAKIPKEAKPPGAVLVLSIIGMVFGITAISGSFIPRTISYASFAAILAAIVSGIALGIACSQKVRMAFAAAALTIGLAAGAVSLFQFHAAVGRESDEHEGEVKTLRGDLSRMSEEHRSEIEGFREQLDMRDQGIADLRTKNQQAASDHNRAAQAHRQEIRGKDQQIASFGEQITTLERQLKGANTQVADLEKEKKDLQTRAAEGSGEPKERIRILQGQVTEANRQVADLEKEKKDLQIRTAEESGELKERVKTLQGQVTEANRQVADLSKENKGLQTRVAELLKGAVPPEVVTTLRLLQRNPLNGTVLSNLGRQIWLVDGLEAKHAICAAYCVGFRMLGQQDLAETIHQYLRGSNPSGEYAKLTSATSFVESCRACSGKGYTEIPCPTCGGNGKCRTCGGRGKITRPKSIGGRGGAELPCAVCGGTGNCPRCRGKGKIRQSCATCKGRGSFFNKQTAQKKYEELLTEALRLAEGEGR